MARAFAPRGIFVTWADRYHHIRLSAGAQKTAAAAAILVVAWSVAATTGAILDQRALATKDAEIAGHRAAYDELAQTVERARVQGAEREARIESLRAALNDATADRLALRSERESLRDRVGVLEQTLADLREAEQSVIERLSEQARDGVDIVERAIEMTGLDVADLITGTPAAAFGRGDVDQADLGAVGLGQGGPFVPAGEALAEPPPSAELANAVAAIEQHLDRWSALRQVIRSLPLSAPLDQYRISSAYGQRRDPMTDRQARHLGVDFVAPFGSPVLATAPGTVTFAGRNGRYGQMIEIEHGYGVRTRYAHLRKILVQAGQQVAHRQTIGLLGSSGRSTGPHVHYEVRFEGRSQNPMRYIRAGKHLFKG